MLDAMLMIVRDEYPALLDDARRALAAQDMDALVSVAHKIKGMSLNVGATHVAAACSSLERASRLRIPEGATTALTWIEQESQTVVEWLASSSTSAT